MGLSLGARLKQKRNQDAVEKPAARPSVAWADTLTSAFAGGLVQKTPDGSYLHITENRPGAWPQAGSVELLYNQLQLIYGVGPYYASDLHKEGYSDLRSLLEHPRWGGQAKRLVEAITDGNVELLANRGALEGHLLGYFDPTQTAFIDLETTGLSGTRPLFLIGTLHQEGGHLVFHQYLARCFDEEPAAVLAALKHLGQFDVWVSFNGRAFDIPYLKTRAQTFGFPFPKPRLHIDLLRTSRRLYRDLLPNCRLTTLESYLLNHVRFDDVPGDQIPELYHRFVVEQNPALLTGVLRHNIEDLYALSQLMFLLNEEVSFASVDAG